MDLILVGLMLFKELCIWLFIRIKGEFELLKLVFFWSIKVGVVFGLLEVWLMDRFVMVFDKVCVGLE